MDIRNRSFSRHYARLCLLAVSVTLADSAKAQSVDPLTGTWGLDLARTHYGGGADQRKEETFVWESSKEEVKCTIRSLRSDGRALVGSFTAAYDGKPYRTIGIPGVDQVSLRRVDESIVDATFSYKDKPVFAYRAMRSRNGKSLIIVSVDPVSHAVLHSVVVYERQ